MVLQLHCFKKLLFGWVLGILNLLLQQHIKTFDAVENVLKTSAFPTAMQLFYGGRVMCKLVSMS